ncbi:hydrogenase maturation nickel metallochaperone HypA [Aliiglaciecola sp. CAU 1673]|uniref:hydrogenase maturation nickel metallochaperone HypA/HybF n=1 Tax=Aliiglaciecola sp. CAU 1673 TaxID=3032595 RepID=UPI0023DA4C4A|nr:hydrogenase maturation nickel metallochaperone HypA [Aliiglaciecola sp. CAU 1673]MDF2180189.1 hydrogenase maturation nickel metallochaperone HypA [Aliiglaciecola sp. CAU 1673]
MHELSLVRALLENLMPYRHKPISRVVLEVGALSCVDGERLAFCFDLVKAEAELDECELVIENKAAQAVCHQCRRHFAINRYGEACPCGSYDYQLNKGQELMLKQIEFQDV